jgi:Fic family protein
MSDGRLVRLAPAISLKEKRLAALVEGREEAAGRAASAVDEARLLGSLELAEAATAAEAEALRRAQAIRPAATLAVSSLLEWHAAITGGAGGALRTVVRERGWGPPPAPPSLIRGRLETLDHWLATESGVELGPAQRGALVLARLVEILPFDHANGRLSRLAASHVMTSAGGRPPILRGGDRERLAACLEAAFQLQTEPLVGLLEEASERAVDVAIAALEA